MQFTETPLLGAWVVDLKKIGDERGFFARAYCANEFKDHGLNPNISQMNMSYNPHKGAIRGLHFQGGAASEAKFMRCISGAIYDVIVDLRPDSETYMQHFGVELSAKNRRALFVPEMFAHGYLALNDDTEVIYSASAFYTPGEEGGFRYDDPALNIKWPIPVEIVSDKDRSWPLIKK